MRGPNHVVKKGRTPVLDREEARALFSVIDTTGRTMGTPQRMGQSDECRVIERRAKQAGIKTKIGNHSSPHTTKLYDRRNDELTLDEYEKGGD